MILPCQEQPDSFFGDGGIFDHASRTYPTVDAATPFFHQMIQRARLAHALQLASTFAISMAVYIFVSGIFLSNANDTLNTGTDAVLAHVSGDHAVEEGIELYIYQLDDFPAEDIQTVTYSDGTHRYFYIGDNALNDEPTQQSDTQVMAASDE